MSPSASTRSWLLMVLVGWLVGGSVGRWAGWLVQETNAKSRAVGTWPYFMEEAVSHMAWADKDWAEVVGIPLLQILRDHQVHILSVSSQSLAWIRSWCVEGLGKGLIQTVGGSRPVSGRRGSAFARLSNPARSHMTGLTTTALTKSARGPQSLAHVVTSSWWCGVGMQTRLPVSLSNAVWSSVRLAARASLRRNVLLSYTSSAAANIYLTLVAGESLGGG